MADTKGEGAVIFRQSAMSRIASADDLDKYIKVTNPSAWVVLLASILLVAGLAIWSATAIIPTTIDVTGIIRGNEVTCWVNEETQEKVIAGGAHASVMDVTATGITVRETPLSKAEVKRQVDSDYLMESITLDNWNYELTITLPNKPDGIGDGEYAVPVSLTVSETHPLNLVLGNK